MEADRAREDAVRCALAGIAAVDPGILVTRALADRVSGPRVSLVAAGKAAASMAAAAGAALGPSLRGGVLVAPEPVRIDGYPIVAYVGGHPVPSEEGMRGAESIARLVESLTGDDSLLCLLSGGASSLMTLPAHGLTLDDVRTVTLALMRAGATIEELNCVRKHIDRLKGGRLAALASPATVQTLVLSDVVGDALTTIASGPTVPDPTTVADAIRILQARDVWDIAPAAVRAHLERGDDESPKHADALFSRTTTRVIGSNTIAVEAACNHARSLGYSARVVTTAMTGEAREVGVAIATMIHSELETCSAPVALVFGGETTVTVSGSGLGGRNQELALAVAIELDGTRGVTVASIATDGIDGPTNAAGAVADGWTLARARECGMNPHTALHDNDAYHFWQAMGDLVITGPTGTNVMDLVIAIAWPAMA